MGLSNRLIAFTLFFICPFFCLFRVNLCHSFSQDLRKLQSLNMAYIWRMNDYFSDIETHAHCSYFSFLCLFFFFFLILPPANMENVSQTLTKPES